MILESFFPIVRGRNKKIRAPKELNNDKDNVFYTRTMAKVHADQGNLLKAAEIYVHLLKSEPECQDLKDALSEIEIKLNEKSPNDLVRLFGQWVELLLKHNNVKKLMRFRSNLRRSK